MNHALLSVALWVSVSPALAQTHAHPGESHSPYAAMAQREIKALSEEQISDLRAGRGMSLALAAELNGLPGPRHALDLGEPLGLTPPQRTALEAFFAGMQNEAAALGARIIDSERALDRLFATRTVTEDNLAAATAQVAALQGELRAVHLKYHLRTRDLLTATQVARYDELRGYRAARLDLRGANDDKVHRHTP